MNTLIKRHVPLGSDPSRDDDPTGVSALLSSLAEPDPMPDHLVARINASLAAAQAQRAAGTSSSSVTPLLATSRRRPRRLAFALAGTAAAVALVAAVSSDVFRMSQPTTESGSSAIASSASTGEALRGQPPGVADQARKSSGGSLASRVQIRTSGTRYTKAAFLTQSRTLLKATSAPQQSAASGVGPASTTAGLLECLRAIGAAGAQVVRADVAFYDGQPAVIIVTTTDSIPVGYVVSLHCSLADAAVFRPATPLP